MKRSYLTTYVRRQKREAKAKRPAYVPKTTMGGYPVYTVSRQPDGEYAVFRYGTAAPVAMGFADYAAAKEWIDAQ